MDESERRIREEKAQREAAEEKRHENAVKHALPAWGFAPAPLAGFVGSGILEFGRLECYGSMTGGYRRIADHWWCDMIPVSAANDSNYGNVLGFVIGLVAYAVIYAVVYLRS
ncbi:hypothetical protein [Arthrobacter sp. SAFR-044]|uniref:hypothetical protein n=1 Tax=Arthrobacter sp. SAFR-044 TaxID=3387278 RepID=UPI003F7BC255